MVWADNGGPIRATIAGQMLRFSKRRKRPISDVPRTGRPGQKPRPDAQWNEAAARWEVWSKDRHAWVSLDDGSLQAPAARSVDPLEESLLDPPGMDLR